MKDKTHPLRRALIEWHGAIFLHLYYQYDPESEPTTEERTEAAELERAAYRELIRQVRIVEG